MAPFVVWLWLAAAPAVDAGTAPLTDAVAPATRPGWRVEQRDGAVTLLREAQVPLVIRGLADRRMVDYRLEVRSGPRLTAKARAALVARNEAVFAEREALERRMTTFRGCEADSCPDFEAVTPAQRRLVERWEALNRRLVEVPAYYVGDFYPVSVRVLIGAYPLRPDEQVSCDDCDAVRADLTARLVKYP